MSTNLTSGAAMSTGQVREDGTIYLGYFEDRKDGQHKDWFATAEDLKKESGARLRLPFNQASALVTGLELHGHRDWEIPQLNILSQQFQARSQGAFEGTYVLEDETFENLDGYWSSTDCLKGAGVYDIVFAEGYSGQTYKNDAPLSSRPVRAELRL